jgi:hypothetical protein
MSTSNSRFDLIDHWPLDVLPSFIGDIAMSLSILIGGVPSAKLKQDYMIIK